MVLCRLSRYGRLWRSMPSTMCSHWTTHSLASPQSTSAAMTLQSNKQNCHALDHEPLQMQALLLCQTKSGIFFVECVYLR